MSGACKFDQENAFIAGTCEYLERYALRFPMHNQNIKSFNDISGTDDYLNLSQVKSLQGFDSIQFALGGQKLKPLEADTKLNWVRARKVLDSNQVYVPEEFVILQPNSFFEVTTSGCAIGETHERALYSALCELFERHVVMFFWWKKITPIYLDLEAFLDMSLPKMKWAYGPWIKCIRLMTIPFKIPVFMACFHGENSKRQPCFLMSAACGLNLPQTIERCLSELGGMINTKIRNIDYYLNKKVLPNNNFDIDVYTFQKHQDLYLQDQYRDFIFFRKKNDSHKIKVEDVFKNHRLETSKEYLQLLFQNIRDEGFDPFYIDQTTKDIKEIGLQVIRTFDLNVLDINSQHRNRRWGKKILFDEKHKTIFDLNQAPHPFP